jgi:cellulose synthase/poly-beta-1,6-N-acetylglucosamine synthase-like glycosyltransferase
MIKEIITLVGSLYYVGGISGISDYVLSEKVKREGKIVKTPTELDSHKKIKLLIPALFEESVIATTIDNVADLDHPNHSITIITHKTDPKTANVAREHIKKMGYKNIDVREYDYVPKTKPSALNHALSDLNGEGIDIVGVLDAENWFKRKDVLKNIETYFENPSTGAVQIRIVPVYEKGKLMSQLAQLSACVEFANLYSLPKMKEVNEGASASDPQGKRKKYDGNLFTIGKMSVKNRYTQAPLGGTGCFYSVEVLKELTKMRNEKEVKEGSALGPFDPFGLVEDFQSSVDIIGRLPEPKNVVYDEKDEVYAYFPNTFRQRLRQLTRWSTGKLNSMLKTNVFKLNTNRAKKIELLREYFFNAIPPANFVALGYLAWSVSFNYLGLGVPVPPDTNLSLFTLFPAAYAALSTSDQVYKTCKFYDKKVFSWDTLKYLTASLTNQWFIQPSASLKAYAKVLKSSINGKPNGWEKTPHQKVDINNTEGIEGNNASAKDPTGKKSKIWNYFNPGSSMFYGLGAIALACAAPLSIPVMALGVLSGITLGGYLHKEQNHYESVMEGRKARKKTHWWIPEQSYSSAESSQYV